MICLQKQIRSKTNLKSSKTPKTEETRKKKHVILTREKRHILAEALDIEVSQLIGKKEITDENIRPFRSKNERDIDFAAFNGASGTKDNEIEEYLRALNNYKEKQ